MKKRNFKGSFSFLLFMGEEKEVQQIISKNVGNQFNKKILSVPKLNLVGEALLYSKIMCI